MTTITGICHCHNCQRATGSALAPILAFPKDAVRIEGELKTYQDTGDSAQPWVNLAGERKRFARMPG